MYGEAGRELIWKLPVYNTIWHMLRNPTYAGGYAFGKTEARIRVVGGRARKTIGPSKPVENWTVLIRDHHSGYITWEQYERNQALLADNAHMKSRMEPKAGRGGRSLLAGLLRCRRCGRMLHVAYSGKRSEVPRYHCRGAHINHGAAWCISFGGLRPDQAIAAEILKAVEGNAVEAAVEAATRIAEQRRQQRQALALELEQAQYEARLAARRYEAVDPDNRLVAAEPARPGAAETVRRWRPLWRIVRPAWGTRAPWSASATASDSAPTALEACPLPNLLKQHLIIGGPRQRDFGQGQMRIIFQIQLRRAPFDRAQQKMFHRIEGDGGEA
jgi:hypothetical protein